MNIKKCSYCGKEKTVEEMHKGKIMFMDFKWDGTKTVKFINEKTNWYCNDSDCQGYDQMAHEG